MAGPTKSLNRERISREQTIPFRHQYLYLSQRISH
jgi:hypothetical protein